ncbi:MAG: SWIM zinc finger family protein [Desulfotomaculaceae bacterium]|nr:SWIM zinc finger family protein [Desulfotomaculaceae bacterium]
MSNEISSRQLTDLAEKIYSHLSRDVISQGLDYNKNNRVNQIEFKDSIIYSVVNGANLYSIKINLNDFAQSTCTCQEKTYCKHIAATFFCIYARHYSPESNARAKQPPPKKIAGSHKKIDSIAQPGPEGLVEVWFSIFEREYGQAYRFVKQYFKPFVDHEYYNHFYKVYDEFKKKVNVYCNNWPLEFQNLYQTYANLYILTHLEDASQKYDKIRWEYYIIEGYEKDLIGNLPTALNFDHLDKFMPLLQNAMDIIRKRLFQKNSPLFNWLLIYRCMYSILGHDPQWVHNETTFLEEIMREADKNHRHFYNATIALAHYRFQSGLTNEALIILQQLNNPRLVDLHYYLDFFYTSEQWNTLYQWLNWLIMRMENNQDSLGEIFDYCVAAMEKSHDAEKFVQILKSGLPQSLEHYATILLHARRHQEWAELRACYWSASDEEVIEKEADLVKSREPIALIPIYHQWVLRLIEERNRRSYQNAVKILKKLRSIYKEQKMIHSWNVYISQLAARYTRMRAFQEELQKGGLIHHDHKTH